MPAVFAGEFYYYKESLRFEHFFILHVFYLAATDAFEGLLRVTNKNYTAPLSNSTSPEYQQLANKICSEVRN